MTSKKTLLFIVMIAGILNQACKKNWLDIKPDKNQVVPKTIPELQALLDNAQYGMNYFSPGLGEVASDDHYIPEGAWVNASDNAKNAYSWSRKYSNINSVDWTASYQRVFTCNLVLDELSKTAAQNTGQAEDYNNCKGQALFHRAFNFYSLAQIYAQPYNVLTAGLDLGIPLRLNIDITQTSVRASVAETYKRIIADLDEALALLPEKPLYLTRPSKRAAFALLARVNLVLENYDKAIDFSDKCLQAGNELLDYNTIPPIRGNPGIFNKEVIFHTVISDVYSGFISDYCLVDSMLYRSYADNDLRKSLFFESNPDRTVSFIGNYNNNQDLFAGLATDEIYLIRAESLARNGNTMAALNDLNFLLQKRWRDGFFNPVKANNPDEALDLVIKERRKELLLRGLRWTDLRRLNGDARFKIKLLHPIGGQNYELEPASYKYTFPVPDDIIAISRMQQNPGW